MLLLNGLCRRRLSLEEITTDGPVLAKHFSPHFTLPFFFSLSVEKKKYSFKSKMCFLYHSCHKFKFPPGSLPQSISLQYFASLISTKH